MMHVALDNKHQLLEGDCTTLSNWLGEACPLGVESNAMGSQNQLLLAGQKKMGPGSE